MTGVKTVYAGRPMQPCGTPAAYLRHRRRGEEPCEPCRQAKAGEAAAYRAAHPRAAGASTPRPAPAPPPPPPPGWERDAACGEVDPELFFAEEGSHPDAGRPLATAAAQRWCAGCPVRRECSTTGDVLKAVGVWGGVVRWRHRGQLRRVDLLGGDAA